jgi:hypothetical protein
VSPNCLFTFVDDSLPTKFDPFCPASPIQHTFSPSSDVNCERSPALDLHPLPVDDLTGDDGSAAALCAELGRDTPSDAAWGDDPRELRRCRARSRSKSSWERWGFDACGGGLRRTRKGGTSALRDVGLHGDLWEGGRADPTWDHHGGRPHAEQPELVRPIPGASARGAILPRRILWAYFYPTRISSTCPGVLRRDPSHAGTACGGRPPSRSRWLFPA